jgi:hypothetical protein
MYISLSLQRRKHLSYEWSIVNTSPVQFLSVSLSAIPSWYGLRYLHLSYLHHALLDAWVMNQVSSTSTSGGEQPFYIALLYFEYTKVAPAYGVDCGEINTTVSDVEKPWP